MRPGKGLPPMLQITIFDDDQQGRMRVMYVVRFRETAKKYM